MDKGDLSMKEIFKRALNADWRTVGLDTQYAITEHPDYVILSFQGSASRLDWFHNFKFIAKPYKNQPVKWYAHSGFVKVWRAAKDQVVKDVTSIIKRRKLIITGYSHGGALAILAHECFVWAGLDPQTYAFGAPRVLWMPPSVILDRFSKCLIVRRRGDIVTHLPPEILGFRHTKIMDIGTPATLSHKMHYPDQYLDNL